MILVILSHITHASIWATVLMGCLQIGPSSVTIATRQARTRRMYERHSSTSWQPQPHSASVSICARECVCGCARVEVVVVGAERFYVHKICSPTRCAIQSGRAPIHVNVQNVKPEAHNPDDAVGGYQVYKRACTHILCNASTRGQSFLKILHAFRPRLPWLQTFSGSSSQSGQSFIDRNPPRRPCLQDFQPSPHALYWQM